MLFQVPLLKVKPLLLYKKMVVTITTIMTSELTATVDAIKGKKSSPFASEMGLK